MVMMRKTLEKVEITPAVFVFSLLQPLFSCFGVSAALSSQQPWGAIYI
jgi:hypothetical protein